ncbi:MAG: hypothetical protein ACOC5T_00490 [Elusimicrobiota bacterium]
MKIPEIRKCECGGEMRPMISVSERFVGMHCSDCKKVIHRDCSNNMINQAISELASYLEENNVGIDVKK